MWQEQKEAILPDSTLCIGQPRSTPAPLSKGHGKGEEVHAVPKEKERKKGMTTARESRRASSHVTPSAHLLPQHSQHRVQHVVLRQVSRSEQLRTRPAAARRQGAPRKNTCRSALFPQGPSHIHSTHPLLP